MKLKLVDVLVNILLGLNDSATTTQHHDLNFPVAILLRLQSELTERHT